MRIVVTGASGGVGRSLMRVLAQSHDMTGVVRTPPAGSRRLDSARYVVSSDRAGLAAAFAEADCVIHCALDSRTPARDFLAVNRKMNAEILEGALAGACRLYVFISSQVVYSGIDPADADGYREEQPLVLSEGLDDYTRLKIESERAAIEACQRHGVDWLVLRPTVVMGPGLSWSDGVVKASRWLAAGVSGRTMNLVHVDDLSRQLERLLARGAVNDIYNLGSRNVPTADYFAEVARIVRRPLLLLPGRIMDIAGRLLPSTMWFFARDVAINCGKVAAATGFASGRPLAAYFSHMPQRIVARSLDELRAIQNSPHPFRAHGQGYHMWFNGPHGDDQVSLREYRGVLSMQGDEITVRSGTRLDEIADYLDARGLALPTLPEFLGISAGACFFVDVHGSSRDYFSLYECITAIAYLDADGNEIRSRRDEEAWAELRARRQNFIVTEVTFQCVPATDLADRMEWLDDSVLETLLAGGWRDNLATTIQWYPHYRRLLVYNVNPVEGPVAAAAARSVAPFRGLPYRAQQLLLAARLRGRALQVDRWHRILAPWRRVPLEPLVAWLYRHRRNWRDVEFCLRIEEGRQLVPMLRHALAAGDIRLSRRAGLGFRFGHDRRTGQDHVWVEFVSNQPEQVEKLLDMARRVSQGGLRFHPGKSLPR